MARRSNKTAHVLNLLAGHDSQNPTEETTANETAPSPSEAAPAEEAAQPSDKEDAKPDAAQPVKTDPEPVTVSAPVSAQNISVIDTTGTDPVAELIQQELSNQFESELAAVSPNAAADSKAETDTQDVEPQITEPEKVTETAAAAEILDDTQTATAAEILDDTQTAAAAEILDDTQIAAAAEILDDTQTAATAEILNDTEAKETVTIDFTPSETESAEITETDTAEADVPEPSAINSENAGASETVAADSPEESQTVTADSAAASQQEPAVVSVPDAEAVPKADTVPEPEQAETFTPETETVPEQAEVSVPKADAVPEPEPDFVYLNVMEEIVKDKIIYFMRQFDLCTCERCKADTIALTMNGLMPKYIVTTPAAVAPLVSYYTNRLIPDVTVEAIKACMTVKDNPRH